MVGLPDQEALNREIGSNIHALMVKRDVKGIEIAALLEFEPQSLSARLHGRTPFKAHELVLIAKRLRVDPGQFFTGFNIPAECELELIDGEGEHEEQPTLPFRTLIPVS